MAEYTDEVLADSPIGYWRLGEPSGTTAASEVNSPTLDGTYTNSPTLGVTGALTQSGDTDTAVTFVRASHPSHQSVSLGAGVSKPLLKVGDVLTVEAWFKRAAPITTNYNYIFTQGANAAALRIDQTTNLLHVDKAAAVAIMSSTVAITDTTTWHHVVYTKDGATNKIYLDGVDVSGSVSNATMLDSLGENWIGHDGSSNGFDGSIDEVALYDTALSAARVLAHYEAGMGAEELVLGYQRLYGPAHLATSAVDLYTVPDGGRVRLRHIFANNPTGSPVDFTFSIGDDAAATRLYDSYNIPAGGSLEWAYDHSLVAGEKIQAYAGTSSALVLTVDAYVEPV